jgi:hypothetical protein
MACGPLEANNPVLKDAGDNRIGDDITKFRAGFSIFAAATKSASLGRITSAYASW